jgi:predicted adenine nucleotide alpha hydrolase (AANH) superfamily ATPase
MHVVLHVCCGVCAASAVEKLVSEGYRVSGYFYNPNIHPDEEYNRRLEAAQTIAVNMNFPLVSSVYEPQEWLDKTALLSAEPEGGKRCEVCFRIRLEATYCYMKEIGADVFTTTLTSGTQKPAAIINRIGEEIGGDRFLVKDFKKKGGSLQANEIAKRLSIYRQNYCGCVYSIRKTRNG